MGCSTATTSPRSAPTSRSRAMWARSRSSGRARLLRLRLRLRDERGFTLPELLIAASLMLVVMGAIYGSLDAFEHSASATNSRNDAQQEARAATDLLAGQLRNLV